MLVALLLTMTTIFGFHALVFFFFFKLVSMTPVGSSAQTRNNGFSVKIIPYDSPSSPFYDPSSTPFTRMKQAAEHSIARFQFLSMIATSPNDLRPPVTTKPGGGRYMMKMSMGSTSTDLFAVIDTGSDLFWTHCVPCDNCNQPSTPIFDPAKSSSYANLGCNSPFCKDQWINSCDGDACHFRITYNDQTKITGVLAKDKMTLDSSDGSPFSFHVIFGCGHTHTSPNSSPPVGLVGLGRGPLSLISQLGSVAVGRFSYCFTDFADITQTSIMHFGPRAEVSGAGLIRTPIATVPGRESLYYLTLDDISVGSQKLNIPPGTFHVSSDGHGGLIIDSGTTVTFLHKVGYDMMLSALKTSINFPVAETPFSPFQFCYDASKDDIIHSFPDVTFHFLGGDVIVGAWNIFVEMSSNHACLAVFPSSNGVSLYGNIVQQDFLVGYDLTHQMVSFAHADCTTV